MFRQAARLFFQVLICCLVLLRLLTLFGSLAASEPRPASAASAAKHAPCSPTTALDRPLATGKTTTSGQSRSAASEQSEVRERPAPPAADEYVNHLAGPRPQHYRATNSTLRATGAPTHDANSIDTSHLGGLRVEPFGK
ncbi:MAG: hypothetical protein K1X74_21110 [Pirellulales bacterium]|nr:hypothetical protein [Pirellulales bacterium]